MKIHVELYIRGYFINEDLFDDLIAACNCQPGIATELKDIKIIYFSQKPSLRKGNFIENVCWVIKKYLSVEKIDFLSMLLNLSPRDKELFEKDVSGECTLSLLKENGWFGRDKFSKFICLCKKSNLGLLAHKLQFLEANRESQKLDASCHDQQPEKSIPQIYSEKRNLFIFMAKTAKIINGELIPHDVYNLAVYLDFSPRELDNYNRTHNLFAVLAGKGYLKTPGTIRTFITRLKAWNDKPINDMIAKLPTIQPEIFSQLGVKCEQQKQSFYTPQTHSTESNLLNMDKIAKIINGYLTNYYKITILAILGVSLQQINNNTQKPFDTLKELGFFNTQENYETLIQILNILGYKQMEVLLSEVSNSNNKRLGMRQR